jgi:hypothetical protein
MRTKRWPTRVSVFALLTLTVGLIAQEPADALKSLQARNALLEERVKNLEDQLERRVRALEEQLDLKTKVVDRKTESDQESAAAKRKDAPASKFKASDWVNMVRVASDIRMRYDEVFAPDSNFVTRWRIRPRLRLGAIVSLKEDWELGFRLASAPSVAKDSGGDPLSTNLTMEDNGSRKPVGVDWAFARWTPLHSEKSTASFALGKLENPPNFTENVFDVDYTPEGFAEQLSYKISQAHTASAYFGQYVLDEQSFSSKDPLLFLEQVRLESRWSPRVGTAFTLSGLTIVHPASLSTASVPDSNHGNTRTAGGVLVNDYNLVIADASITFGVDNFLSYDGPLPIKLVAEYIHNFGASDNNSAFSFGTSFGKVAQTGKVRKGDWEVSYRFQELQGDSNYEELTASDNGVFYRSRPVAEPGTGAFRPTFLNGLNLRGHAFRIAYVPADFLVLDARLWLNRPIRASAQSEKMQGARLLLDFVWRL